MDSWLASKALVGKGCHFCIDCSPECSVLWLKSHLVQSGCWNRGEEAAKLPVRIF